MKLIALFTLALSLNTYALEIKDPKNLMPRIDNFLAAKDFKEAITCGDRTLTTSHEFEGTSIATTEVTECSDEDVFVTTFEENNEEVTHLTRFDYEETRGNILRLMQSNEELFKFKSQDSMEILTINKIQRTIYNELRNVMDVKLLMNTCDNENCFTFVIDIVLVKDVPLLAQLQNLTINFFGSQSAYTVQEFTRK